MERSRRVLKHVDKKWFGASARLRGSVAVFLVDECKNIE